MSASPRGEKSKESVAAPSDDESQGSDWRNEESSPPRTNPYSKSVVIPKEKRVNPEQHLISKPIASGTVGTFEYEITRRRDKRHTQLRLDEHMFEIRFSQSGNATSHFGAMWDAFYAVEHVMGEVVRYLQGVYEGVRGSEHAQIRLSAMSDDLKDGALHSPQYPLKEGQKAVETILYQLDSVLQSKNSMAFDDSFQIHVTVLKIPPLSDVAIGGKMPTNLPRGQENIKFLIFPAPTELFKDSCLLTSIVLGLAYNREMRACTFDAKLNRAKTTVWGALSRCNSTDQTKAKTASNVLQDEVIALCHETSIDPELFRLVSINSLEKLRPLLDRFEANIHLYSAGMGYQLLFQHPPEYDPKIETVTILCAEEVLRNTDPDEPRMHCGLITRVKRFLSAHNLAPCIFCQKNFTPQYFKYHKCPKRKICAPCRRILVVADDYLDFSVLEERCISSISRTHSLRCSKCNSVCFTRSCYAHHKKMCKYLECCKSCSKVYKIRKGQDHKCGHTFCLLCKKPYKQAGKTHRCEIGRPAEQKAWNKLAVFDTETVSDPQTGEHRVNAVGLSFETDNGWFSEIYFYDDEMKHPEDGVMKEKAFFYQYWPESTDADIPRPKAPVQRLERFYARKEKLDRLQRKRHWDGTAVERAGFIDAECAEAPDGEEEEEEEEQESECGDVLEEVGWCGGGFDPTKAMEKFAKYLIESRIFYSYTLIAHNGAKFDSILLLRALIEMGFLPHVLFDGHKLLSMTVPVLKLRVIDSYRFIRVPLSKFKSRFPYMDCQEKGLFPYRFNKPEHYHYKGGVPERDYFVDKFSTEQYRKEVDNFIRDMEGCEWDFIAEMHKYLRQDVVVLRAGAVAVLKEYFEFQLELGKKAQLLFNCFSPPFVTGPSFSHNIFLFYALPEGKVFLLDNQRNARKTSRRELEWLDYVAESENLKIRNAFNHPKGQYKIGPYYVDGVCQENKTVYEFLGCLFHGHVMEKPQCTLSKGCNPSSRTPFGRSCLEVHREWEKKKKFLTKEGWSVVWIWECEYLKEEERGGCLKSFLESYYKDGKPRERLMLRGALRGGRTESFRLLFAKEKNPNTKLHYIDKNSLYPTIAINHSFPVGHPEVYIGEKLKKIHLDDELGFVHLETGRPLIGLVQATMLPPDSLFLPVLPTCAQGKLMFGLCRTCMNANKGTVKKWCTHSDLERQITDVWTSAEIESAVKNGYRVKAFHEMFMYDQQEPLFREFYTKVARIKLESEGFPKNCVSAEEKKEHVRKINLAMPGLDLKVERVCHNEARRQFAKDLSNNGLGKWSQDDVKTRNKFVSSWTEISKIMYSHDHTLVSVNPVASNRAEVVYEPIESRIGYHKNVHVIIYAFVTAYARLSMLRDMQKLQHMGGRVFYTDTGE